jgi:hypothetical protein
MTSGAVVRTFHEHFAVRRANTPDNYSAAEHVGDWIPLAGYARRVEFLFAAGPSLAGNVAVKVQEATSAAGAGAADISGKSGTITAGTDDSLPCLIQVDQEDLSEGFTHVRLVATPAGGAADFAAFALLYDLYELPADNTVNTDVGFVVS